MNDTTTQSPATGFYAALEQAWNAADGAAYAAPFDRSPTSPTAAAPGTTVKAQSPEVTRGSSTASTAGAPCTTR